MISEKTFEARSSEALRLVIKARSLAYIGSARHGTYAAARKALRASMNILGEKVVREMADLEVRFAPKRKKARKRSEAK